jgi:hypothetical protein
MNGNDVEEQIYLTYCPGDHCPSTRRFGTSLCEVGMVAAGICHLWLPCHLSLDREHSWYLGSSHSRLVRTGPSLAQT